MNENKRENQKIELITRSRVSKKHIKYHSLISRGFKAIRNHNETANYIRLETLATYSLLDGKRIQLGIKTAKLYLYRIRSHRAQWVFEINPLINRIHYLARTVQPIPAGALTGVASRRPFERAARPHLRGSQIPRY